MLLTYAGMGLLEHSELHFPISGRWFGHVRLASQTLPIGANTLAVDGGFSFVGAMAGGGDFLDSQHVHIAGGKQWNDPPKTVIGAFTGAKLRDLLNSIAKQAGETVSSKIDASLLAMALPFWTITRTTRENALDQLAAWASRTLGETVNWRHLGDGSIWMGVETWPTVQIPEGSDILEWAPEEGRYVIGCDKFWLTPGCTVPGIGQVSGVDHYIEADQLRTWAWVGSDAATKRRKIARASVGMDPSLGALPMIDLLGQYRAEVKVASSDGKTLDITPEDKRIPPHQGLKNRYGVPGLTSVVKPGAIVLIGWERGDPSRPYCEPSFESAAGVSKATWIADQINLGGDATAGAQPGVLGTNLMTWLASHTHAPYSPPASPPPSTILSNVVNLK